MTTALNPSRNPFEPANFTTDAYDSLPPPTDRDLGVSGSRGRGRPSLYKDGELVATRAHKDWLVIVDRIIQARVVPIKTRGDALRLALFEWLGRIVEQLHNAEITTTYARLQRITQVYREATAAEDLREGLFQLRTLARMGHRAHDQWRVISSLKEAKALLLTAPEPVRSQGVELMYGAVWGEPRPEMWIEDDVAVLWDKVWEGGEPNVYDLDDDEKLEAAQSVPVAYE